MPFVQPPAPIGIMLCDQVIFERGTQKPSLIGVFTGVAASQFPSVPQRFDVFVALTNGIGDGVIDLVVIRLETEEQIAAQSMECSFRDPLHVTNVRFRFRQISLPAAGEYLVALLVDGNQKAQRRVRVYQVEELP